MTQLLSTQGTSEIHGEPDTSLIDAAREIAPIIREHSEEAERERRLSQHVLKALRETGLLANDNAPLPRGVGDRPRHPRPRR